MLIQEQLYIAEVNSWLRNNPIGFSSPIQNLFVIDPIGMNSFGLCAEIKVEGAR
jgi:hypothetical protein